MLMFHLIEIGIIEMLYNSIKKQKTGRHRECEMAESGLFPFKVSKIALNSLYYFNTLR